MLRFGVAPYLECSTRGDRRFSAFVARLRSVKAARMFPNCGMHGLSIEGVYQAAKVFADGSTGLSWQMAKGRAGCINQEEVRRLYSALWDMYIEENPELLVVLRAASGLSDTFGQPGHACQAEELWRIRMRHSDPYIQELVEQLQGALRMFTDRRIVWNVRDMPGGGWRVRFVIINTRHDNYSVAFVVSRRAVYDIQLHGLQFWDSLKWNIIRSCVWKVIEDSKPVAEQDVEYMAEVEPWTADR
jgi:hypothetical protein